MNEWMAAGAALILLLIPCGMVAMRGSVLERLLGLELGGVVASLAFLVLSEAFDRSIYFDLALVFTLMSWTANLVVVRFVERWL